MTLPTSDEAAAIEWCRRLGWTEVSVDQTDPFVAGCEHIRSTELREMEATLKSEQANYRGALSACNANSSRANSLEAENSSLRLEVERLRSALETISIGQRPYNLERFRELAREALNAGKEETK